ncbi:MAG: universal stress protein, partial [Haloarculaceae archaeon]
MSPAAGGASEAVADGPDAGQTADRILYPLFERPDELTLEVLRTLAVGIEGEAIVLDLFTDDRSAKDESGRVAGSVLHSELEHDPTGTVRPLSTETDHPVGTLVDLAQTLEPGLVVFDDRIPRSIGDALRGPVTGRVGSAVPCDVVRVSTLQHVKRISSILVPIASGPHSDLAARVAGAIGLGGGAVVDLFHVAETADDSTRVRTLFESAMASLPSEVEVETWHIESAEVAGEI